MKSKLRVQRHGEVFTPQWVVDKMIGIAGIKEKEETDLYKSARTIIWANIVQGNTLTHKNQGGEEITFSRWSQVSDTERMVERTTFTYSSLFSESKAEKTYVQSS